MIGKCAKQEVFCILEKDGKCWVGSNYCLNPQKLCPRKEGEDYTKCKTICKQPNHAEVDVIKKAKKNAINSTMYIIGHYHYCKGCEKMIKKNKIKEVKFVRR